MPSAEPTVTLADMIATSDKWAKEFLVQNTVILDRQSEAAAAAEGDVLKDACLLPPTIFISGRGEAGDHGASDSGAHEAHNHVVNMHRNMSMEVAATQILRSSSLANRNRLKRVASGFPEPEACLADSWCGAALAYI